MRSCEHVAPTSFGDGQWHTITLADILTITWVMIMLRTRTLVTPTAIPPLRDRS